MKKVLIAFSVFLFAGCSNDNQLTINNLAEGGIIINFRGKEYSVNSGQTYTIPDEIPNGKYNFSTTFEIPYRPGIKSGTSDGAAAGELGFQTRDTKVHLLYSSSVADSVYTLHMTQSSSQDNNFDPSNPLGP
jgi:hypothetical protein